MAVGFEIAAWAAGRLARPYPGLTPTLPVMPGEVRIGDAPAPLPPKRSSRVLIAAAVLVLLAAAGAWLAGTFGESASTTTAPEIALPSSTTAPGATTTTTLPPADLLAAARLFWTAVGSGDSAAAAAAFPAANPAATDLMGFVAAFRPYLAVGDCFEFASNAAQCEITVQNGDLLAIGEGTATQRLLVEDDGWFDVPTLLGVAAARLSLYALDIHTEGLHAACPITDNPQVPRLAIVGSATPECGAYLAGLIPEYLSAGLHLRAGAGG
jgi:hypothetical protein